MWGDDTAIACDKFHEPSIKLENRMQYVLNYYNVDQWFIGN